MQTEIAEGYRLSPQQKQLWLLQQNAGALPYLAVGAILIEGDFDVGNLKAALADVVYRHEILRTTYQSLAAMTIPVQVISERGIFWGPSHDLSDWSPPEQEIRIEALLEEALHRSFDLAVGPLLHASLLTLAPTRGLLVVTLPAMCADRVTLRNLTREISRSYAACFGERITEEPMQYADLSSWQNELIESESAAAGKEFWRRQDVRALLALKLPFEIQPPDDAEFAPQVLTQTLPAGLAAQIKQRAGQHDNATPVFLLTCWQILLSRHTGDAQILVGTAYDGRNYEELDEALGLFAKHLPIVCHLEDGARFHDVLARNNASFSDAYKWQECFTWELVAGSAKNDPRFFPIAFEYEKQAPKYFARGATFSLQQQYVCHDRFKVKLALIETEVSLIAELRYDANLIPTEHAGRLLLQFEAILQSAIANPQNEIGRLNLLHDAERPELVEFNQTKAVYPTDKCVHELFEDQARRHPQRVAVKFEEQSLTFAELNARANKLAHYLRSLGAAREAPVAICLERSLEIVVGLLGILKSGSAYLPLDPTLPPERMAFMLADAGAKILVTQQQQLQHVPEGNEITTVCLDADSGVIDRQSDETPTSQVTPENLVYVLFTSGSTGWPKGVCVEHRQLLNYVHAIRERFEFVADASFASLSTFAADLGNTMIFPSLCGGGCLHVVSPERAANAEMLADYFDRQPVDYLKIVPSHLEALLLTARPESILPARRLILGGEASTRALIENLTALAPACGVANHYGPTEATVGVLTYQLNSGRRESSATLPLGRPIPNAQVYVLDAELKPLPVWAIGELYIGGAGVARGYLNRPQLTAEKFIPNPFSGEPGERLYKTGDLARYLPGGNIEFLGRTDQQVKIRGFRVELGEIEMALKRHPVVQAAVVQVRAVSAGKQQLVAYVVADEDRAPATSEFRDFLRRFLPEHMLPGVFVILKVLPLTPNGKVDRQALPAPEESWATKIEYVAPRDELEFVLAGVWEKVLGLAPVGIFDNYFALGGDSIRVIQLVHEANRYRLAVTAMAVFQYPTVHDLARYIRDGRNGRNINEPAPLDLIQLPEHVLASLPDEIEDAYPLAKMQEFLIFQYEHDGQQMGVYHIQHSYHIHDESFSLDSFKKALQLLTQKHPAFRTVFLFGDDQPLQAVKKKSSLSLLEEDLSDLSAVKQDEHIETAMRKDRARLFDVRDAGAPLFRTTIFLRSEQSVEFFMSMHHAITDGWGNREFANELVELYLALKSGEERELPPATNTYKEFVALEREIIQDAAARNFWKEHLRQQRAGSRRPQARATGPTHATNYVHRLTSALAGQLNQAARASSVSLKAIFLSVYLEVIGAEVGEDVITVGVIANGRSERLSDPLQALGLFWNIIPFTCSLSGGDLSAQIRKVQDLLISTEQYARFPLAQMLEDQQQPELFFATFNFLHFHNVRSISAASGLRLLGFRGHDKFHFPLNYIVSVDPFDGGIGFRVEFDQLYFDEDSVRRLTNRYVELLQSYAETQVGK